MEKLKIKRSKNIHQENMNWVVAVVSVKEEFQFQKRTSD